MTGFHDVIPRRPHERPGRFLREEDRPMLRKFEWKKPWYVTSAEHVAGSMLAQTRRTLEGPETELRGDSPSRDHEAGQPLVEMHLPLSDRGRDSRLSDVGERPAARPHAGDGRRRGAGVREGLGGVSRGELLLADPPGRGDEATHAGTRPGPPPHGRATAGLRGARRGRSRGRRARPGVSGRDPLAHRGGREEPARCVEGSDLGRGAARGISGPSLPEVASASPPPKGPSAASHPAPNSVRAPMRPGGRDPHLADDAAAGPAR